MHDLVNDVLNEIALLLEELDLAVAVLGSEDVHNMRQRVEPRGRPPLIDPRQSFLEVGFVGRNREAIEDAAAVTAAAHRAGGNKGRPCGGGAEIWAELGSGGWVGTLSTYKIKKKLASASGGGASIPWRAVRSDNASSPRPAAAGGRRIGAAAEGGVARAREGDPGEGAQPGGGWWDQITSPL